MTITIHIPNFHPTRLNKLLGHWRVAARLKKNDRSIIQTYCRGLPAATTKRRVTLTIVLGKRQRGGDPDSYFKSALDGLVHAKQLVDDSKEWCELAPVKYLRGDMATIIELEDI
jgi:hypothetical protein